jgi:hypothetical protein
VWTPITALLFYAFVYEPLKFKYVTHAVVSASTPTEELKAFQLAAKAGRIWEVNPMPGNCVEIEWLQSSSWNGKPYRAIRCVISTNNLSALWKR